MEGENVMSVDTKMRLVGNVRPEEIANYIMQVTGKEVLLNIGTADYQDFTIESGYIYFEMNGRKSLFYNRPDCNLKENYDYYVSIGLKEMADTYTTDLLAGKNPEMYDFYTNLVAQFGGWIDYNDCDDDAFKKVEKAPDNNIKPVVHIKLKDLYKQYGAIVIVD